MKLKASKPTSIMCASEQSNTLTTTATTTTTTTDGHVIHLHANINSGQGLRTFSTLVSYIRT